MFALLAAATLVASFRGNAVVVQPFPAMPALRLRLDTGGYDLLSRAAATRAHLAATSVSLGAKRRRIYSVPGCAPCGPALLEARPGALESIFIKPVDGTVSLGRFETRPLTIDFVRHTVETGAAGTAGERIAMHVATGRGAPNLPPVIFATIPLVIAGERHSMLLDTGADVGLPPDVRDHFDDPADTRSLPLISRALFRRLHERHPGWPTLSGARMAESTRAVTLLRIPEFFIGSHRGPPTWFAVRDDAQTYVSLSSTFGTPVDGDAGGEAFRRWRITIDLHAKTLTIR